MKKFDSLVYLVGSMSKSEKKSLTLSISKNGAEQDYAVLYRLIARSDSVNETAIRNAYQKEARGQSFDISMHYLYDRILDVLVSLHRRKTVTEDLTRQLSKARILYERDMFYECFESLNHILKVAREHEAYEILFFAMRLKREYLLRLNFPNMTEQELYHIHHEQKEIIRNIQKITEQGSLFDLLKYRLLHRGNIRSEKQKEELNDLVVRELYISASFGDSGNIFEIAKNHKLFQASYLMGVGESASALNSFRELVRLFDENPQFRANPPVYHLSVLEGILHMLRSSRNYDEMDYFRRKLEALSQGYSKEFKENVACLAFQYEMFPYFDRGDYAACRDLMGGHRELYDNIDQLSSLRKSELLLYTALVHVGLGEYSQAKKQINSILFDRNIEYIPIMKTIRLVRLIVYYELENFDLLQYEIRSIRRGLALKKEQAFKTEYLMLRLLGNENLSLASGKAHARIYEQIEALRNDKYEMQLLVLFDFTAWIESKLKKLPLGMVLSRYRSGV
ncbi:hypothetical protein [Alistipes dispar]|uniref:hypothetical protein n=1 Tax=Alistipes dispar TaxID=2585119 RepID=UPI003A88E7ED